MAVIGDGAITGGMAFEAMNCAGYLGVRHMVILNDNGQVRFHAKSVFVEVFYNTNTNVTAVGKLVEALCVRGVFCFVGSWCTERQSRVSATEGVGSHGQLLYGSHR